MRFTTHTVRRTVLAVTGAAVLGITAMAVATPSIAGGATCKGEAATFVGTDGRDVFDGGPGRDVVVTLGGNDDIDAGGGDDLICAGGGRDEIDGDAGNDVMYGQGGNDEMDGQIGDDTLIGNKGTDDADGEAGFDTCKAEIEDECEA
jgi:Ca2+-binding RTX toxin-like protein